MAPASSAVARPAGYAALFEQYGLRAHKPEHSHAISDQHLSMAINFDPPLANKIDPPLLV